MPHGAPLRASRSVSHTVAYRAPVIAIFLAVLAGLSAFAQGPALDPATAGTLYLLAFPDTIGTSHDPRGPAPVNDVISLYIYSPVATGGRITGRGYDRTITIAGGTVTRFDLSDPAHPAPDIFVDVANIPSTKTFRVEMQSPVVLYCWVMTRAGGEAWTPIPVDKWGKEYHAAMVPGELLYDQTGTVSPVEIETVLKKAWGQIVVIASEDNTRVSFTRPSFFRFETEVKDHTVLLNRGEAYMLRGQVELNEDAEEQWDFGGTRIVADKPIGVVSGNARAQVNGEETGVKNNVYKNMMVEWLPPVEQYGTRFAMLPTHDSHRPGIAAPMERRREFIRVYNGACEMLRLAYLQPGGTARIQRTARRDSLAELSIPESRPVWIETERPAQVMMHQSAVIKFNGSTPCDRGIPCLSYSAVAPYMVEVVAREQWSTFAPYFGADSPDSMEQYVNAVADTIAARRIYREDGTLFPFSRPIPGTDLVWGTDTLRPGAHYLEGRDGARFHAFAYGVRAGWEYYRPDPTHAELDEKDALSFGYPLAPRRMNLQAGCATLGVEAWEEGSAGSIAVNGPESSSGLVTVSYRPAGAGACELAIHDAAGRRVALLVDGMAEAGPHVAVWDAASAPAGVYFCRLSVGGRIETVPVIVRR